MYLDCFDGIIPSKSGSGIRAHSSANGSHVQDIAKDCGMRRPDAPTFFSVRHIGCCTRWSKRSNMQLFIRGQTTSALEVLGNETVFDLKARIFDATGIAVSDQILLHSGRPLDNEEVITESGINELATVDLAVRLLGGKVHGSLARAGKVKGQTPKVDKQEKKKKRTGRAKRRMQYNRRFVNVVPTFGKRRGPNSNS
ncbi:ubiquitin-like FUBI-ribosomal protein eS30 fusion protein isoform X1 [Saccoglossus kowalevskii]